MAANSYLTKIFSSNGNRRTMAISFWIKRSVLGAADNLFGSGQGSVNSFCRFETNSRLKIFDYNGQAGQWILESRRQFLDTTAWYHIHYILDSSQSTAADRVQLYVNGVRETSFITETYPNQDTDFNWNSAAQSWAIGAKIYGGVTGSYFNGQMAHFHFVDGTASAPTVFGETDSTTGIWKPKTNPSVTYGSEGFFLKFENSGALGTDSSGNSNTFTVNGNLKQSISTPSNKFPTFNPRGTADGYDTTSYQLNAGHTALMTTGVNRVQPIDMCFQGGKWYWECKIEKANMFATLGVYMTDFSSAKRIEQFAGDLALQSAADGGKRAVSFLTSASSSQIQNAGSTVTYGANCSDGDIIMFAFDSATGKVWTGRNGTWNNAPGTSNVGDPAAGTNDSGTVLTNTDNDLMSFYISGRNSDSTNRYMYINFGHGYFGTTAVASANADGNGNGSFEYAPPTGFLALCSSNIQSDGG